MKQTLNEQLATKLARLDTLETYKRAMLSDYMPIKNEIEDLKDEVEDLENKLLNIDSAENDKRFDELMGCPIEELKVLKDAGFEEATEEQLITATSTNYKPWSHADEETDNDR